MEHLQQQTLADLRRFYQDEFNRFRLLVELGRKIELILELLLKNEREEIVKRYHEQDSAWLTIYFRKRVNNDTFSKKLNIKRN